MKLKLNVFICFTFLLVTNTLTAAIIKPVVEKPTNKFSIIAAKKIIKQTEQTYGRKLKFKEKIGLFLVIKKINNSDTTNIDKAALGKKMGKNALLASGIGVLSTLLGIVIPFLATAGFLLVILGFVLGIKALKLNKKNPMAVVSIVIGGLYFLILLAVIALVLLFLGIGR